MQYFTSLKSTLAVLAVLLAMTGCMASCNKEDDSTDPGPTPTERKALLERRYPDLYQKSPRVVDSVINDDKKLYRFLTDDDYAQELLAKDSGVDPSTFHLTPFQDIQQALPTATQHLGCGT